MPQTVYTIGHSNLTFMKFLALLQQHNITHIIDIRSIPYSRRAPWSNKSRLPGMLKPLHIRYTYLGHKLGGKKSNLEQFAKQQSASPEEVYLQAVEVVLNLSNKDHLALLCAESDPANCHRQHVVAQTLLNRGAKVVHILKDGSLKDAWLEPTSPKQASLF
jgi:uncharacterized protein (DUF488 family)